MLMQFKAFEVNIISYFLQETKLTNSSAVWRYLIGYKVSLKCQCH